ncbi:MAG: hypothetical protein U0528_04650 [Anaerolineae bacterium]
MTSMRLPPLLLLLVALIVLLIVIAAGSLLVNPNKPLLADVSLSSDRITPNADGQDDVTVLTYTVNRNAEVTITFTNNTTNEAFKFRENERRPVGQYSVQFSGVVAGYVLPTETFVGTVESRLIPNGEYAWTVEAKADNGETAQASGTLIVADGDPLFPAILNLEVSPTVFSPNQDGYDDRLTINVYMAKDAQVRVWLEAQGLGPFYVPERDLGANPAAIDPTVRQFDYDAGVDTNNAPPPDGDYTLVVEAQDPEGQRMRDQRIVTLKGGGLPQAEIVAQQTGRTVTWATLPYQDAYYTDAATAGKTVDAPQVTQSQITTISLPQSDLLLFSLVVSNYGMTPIRTLGPFPGTVYQYEQTAGAMQAAESLDFSTGGWRVGIECERTTTSFPWRWALGSPDQLTKVEDNGQTLYYLMPGQKATVWGAIRMTTYFKTLNPQKCWAGLIHEGVQIPNLQGHVGEIDVYLQTTEQP